MGASWYLLGVQRATQGLFDWVHQTEPVSRDGRDGIGSLYGGLGLAPRMQKGPNRLHVRQRGFWSHGGIMLR
jgi:hypothetical protein